MNPNSRRTRPVTKSEFDLGPGLESMNLAAGVVQHVTRVVDVCIRRLRVVESHPHVREQMPAQSCGDVLLFTTIHARVVEIDPRITCGDLAFVSQYLDDHLAEALLLGIRLGSGTDKKYGGDQNDSRQG